MPVRLDDKVELPVEVHEGTCVVYFSLGRQALYVYGRGGGERVIAKGRIALRKDSASSEWRHFGRTSDGIVYSHVSGSGETVMSWQEVLSLLR